MGRRAYPPEFRAEAVRLVREDKLTYRRVAADLGCSLEAVRQWVRHAEIDDGDRALHRLDEGPVVVGGWPTRQPIHAWSMS